MTVVLTLLLQFLLLMPLAADVPSSLTLPATELTVIPRDVFIGDEMEIRYSFASSDELLPSAEEPLSIQVPDTDDMTVLDMQLSKEFDRYVLSGSCIAWRTGKVQLPEIDVQQFNPLLEEPVLINVPPVTILSVVDYTGKKELRPALAPLVIPGTTWIIYVIIIICVILFVILIVILFRFNAFRSRFIALFSSVLIARNYRILKRRMKRFLKKYMASETEVFATELAHFIRGYMSVRFKTDFDAVTASEFFFVFEGIMNHTGSQESSGATEQIADILLRCDYVRFSGDSGEAGLLSENERSGMCSQFLDAVACYNREAAE